MTHYQICMIYKDRIRNQLGTANPFLANKWYNTNWAITSGWQIELRENNRLIKSRET